jgi:hypothetical protein
MCRALLSLTLLGLLLAAPGAAAAEPPGTGPAWIADDADDLCTADYQVAHRGECPLYGPGGHAERRRIYDLPDGLPALATRPLEPLTPLLSHTYAKVTTPDTPVFASPEDGLNGVVKRTLGTGFIFVSTGRVLQQGDQEFVRINNIEVVRRSDLSFVSASDYQGIALAQQPERPFAWVVRSFHPRLTPGGGENPRVAALERYAIVQIYGKEHHGEYDWYLVGRDQWVEQRNLGIVEVRAPPEGVRGKWVAVNLYEQTMAVYEGRRLVYAALVSSGLGAWPTRPGLHRVYDKIDNTNMSGAFAADRSDYYYIEDVPWVLYFDAGISFHGTYWHNKFGFQQSHGCVNLSAKDARWLYDWAAVGTYVYVYDPSGRTPTTPWTGGGP